MKYLQTPDFLRREKQATELLSCESSRGGFALREKEPADTRNAVDEVNSLGLK